MRLRIRHRHGFEFRARPLPPLRLLFFSTVLTAALSLTGCEGHVCNVSGQKLAVDPAGNGVLEPGETVEVVPTWAYYGVSTPAGCPLSDPCTPSAPLGLFASSFTGPEGGTYDIVHGTANYGSIPYGNARSCAEGGYCYQVSVGIPSGRPVLHWDATLTESNTASTLSFDNDLLIGATCPPRYLVPKTWTVHIGASFGDVLPSDGFYPFVETILHNQITAGCGGSAYCPGSPIRKDQMSVFLLKAEHGAAYVPPVCTGLFVDVPCPGPFTDWVEQVFLEGVILGCPTPYSFCPADPVTRRQMALWLLKAHFGRTYNPPAAQGIFGDVSADDPYASFIEDLFHRHITAGCSAQPLLYCPDDPNTRGQMAVFVAKTFELALY
jgi:hypothetical protein